MLRSGWINFKENFRLCEFASSAKFSMGFDNKSIFLFHGLPYSSENSIIVPARVPSGRPQTLLADGICDGI